MEFPESYFEDEVREGFYVPSIMKKNWAAQLEVLEAVKLVCRKHNIEYFAEWGTMLGAVRHGGIIPWDDDIDICMKRKDYEKFLAVAEEELPEEFCIISSQNSDSMNLVTRVQNSSYPILSAEQMEQFHGFPYSMGIDVFVIDNLPKDEKIRKELHELAYSIAQVNTRLMAGNISLEELQRYLRDIERACQVTFDRTKPIGPQLIRTVEGLFEYFDERNSEELTAISIWLQNENYRLPKSFYRDAISIPFENTDIAVPVEYEALLNRKFVGYMTPVRMWNSHNYPGYQSQIELAKEAGVELLEYRFCREDMDAEKRLPKTSLKGRVMEFAPLFEEAHEELMHLAEMKDWENMRELLGECQNVALQLGTMVEEELGEDTTIVSILEQYCEQVFVVHQSLVQEGAFELKNMVSCMERFWSIVEDEIKEKRLVVFVPYQAKQWNTMNSLWQEAMADESTDVYVIPAPYYYKDVFGNCEKEIQYEDTGYPENIVLTSYEEFNFEIYHPDVLYIQCPYDQYNYAMTIHPFFYASNLRQYTEQLVYVPGLIMDEIDTGDERGRKVLKYYCNMPGVVYADKVLVQSEQMKQVYVELLTEFAGKDTKKLWEEKIVTANYSLADVKKVDFLVDIPTHWEEYIGKGDGQKKKVVLYTTSASALLHGGEAMIVKMKKVLETFYDNRDEVALIWRSDRAVREVLRKDNPKLWRQYSQLVQEYREAGWGIFDDSVDDTVARRLCDACYGDGGSTMNGCRVDGKPVMIQNIGV